VTQVKQSRDGAHIEPPQLALIGAWLFAKGLSCSPCNDTVEPSLHRQPSGYSFKRLSLASTEIRPFPTAQENRLKNTQMSVRASSNTGDPSSAPKLEKADTGHAIQLLPNSPLEVSDEAQRRRQRPNCQVDNCQRRYRNWAFYETWVGQDTRVCYRWNRTDNRDSPVLTAQSGLAQKYCLILKRASILVTI
jgi:hypothetical protein